MALVLSRIRDDIAEKQKYGDFCLVALTNVSQLLIRCATFFFYFVPFSPEEFRFSSLKSLKVPIWLKIIWHWRGVPSKKCSVASHASLVSPESETVHFTNLPIHITVPIKRNVQYDNFSLDIEIDTVWLPEKKSFLNDFKISKWQVCHDLPNRYVTKLMESNLFQE